MSEHYHQVLPESFCDALRARVSGFLGRITLGTIDWNIRAYEAPLDIPFEVAEPEELTLF